MNKTAQTQTEPRLFVIRPTAKKEPADPSDKQVAVNVYNARVEAGITQAELAKLSGRPQGTISSVERGKCSPTVSTLLALANALDIDITRFLEGI